MTIRISVVVPTYKRPQLLARCIQALVRQNIAPEDYEILIVDDAACEETRLQVACLAKRTARSGHHISYHAVTGIAHGPAVARNLGWQAARGEIIAFTDDDCIPEADWLQSALTAFVGDIAAATGKVIVPVTHMPTDYERNAAHLEQSEFVTANSFYRRDVLVALDGFDERFTSAWREDSDLFFTLVERQFSFTSVPEAVVIHPIRPARWGICLQQQRKSMFNALLYKKHPLLYRAKVQAAPPWHYYSIVGAMLLMLLGFTKRSKLLTGSGVCMWTWLTTQFCVQRLQDTAHTPQHIAEMIITSLLVPPLAIFWRLRGAIKFRVFFL